MTTISVLYPATDGVRFDIGYYLDSHMPRTRARFAAFGLRGDRVLKGVRGLDGKAAYQVIALLEFPALQNFLDALAAHGAELMADTKNFTDLAPLIQINEPAG